MTTRHPCRTCGELLDLDELTLFDGELLCAHCLEEETTVCSYCGDRIWRRDDNGDEDTPLCAFCLEQEYTTCSRCGRLILFRDTHYDDDEEPVCSACYRRTEQAATPRSEWLLGVWFRIFCFL